MGPRKPDERQVTHKSFLGSLACRLSISCGKMPETVRDRQRFLAFVYTGLCAMLGVLEMIDRAPDSGLLAVADLAARVSPAVRERLSEDRSELGASRLPAAA